MFEIREKAKAAAQSDRRRNNTPKNTRGLSIKALLANCETEHQRIAAQNAYDAAMAAK